MRILVGAIAASLVLGVIVLELFAPTIATRTARATVERCVPVRELEVTSIARPAVLGFIRGEVRDVRVSAADVQVGALMVATVAARLPAVSLGWGTADGSTTVVADVTLTQEDLTDYLDAVAPEFADPRLTITPDGLDVGDTRVPFTLELRAILVDGDVQLVPAAGDPRLWSSLGLELDVEVPDPIELLALRSVEGQMELTARAVLEPGAERQPMCPDLSGFEP
ncbi:MAG: DUF2993 domain-containing protein [Intrasporangiaceae bacterium]|nr:DUF2993 domain-containing protein [Intrasporangiaceae bacterium]